MQGCKHTQQVIECGAFSENGDHVPCPCVSLVLAGEKAALMARLAKLKDAGAGELRERAELQEALVR